VQHGHFAVRHTPGTGSKAFTNFVINTKAKHVTAIVSRRSMPVFDVSLASSSHANGPHGTIVESNIKLAVTSRVAAALNSRLGAGAFKAGNNFGIATLTLAYARGHP
jgi:hypothetical protein